MIKRRRVRKRMEKNEEVEETGDKDEEEKTKRSR